MSKIVRHVHIFTRDLRTTDNNAFESFDKILPLFHFNTEQLHRRNKSDRAISFMRQTVSDLGLTTFEGTPAEFCDWLEPKVKNARLTICEDHTKYAIKRQQTLKKRFPHLEIIEDMFLCDPALLLKKDGTCYTSFGSFYKNADKIKVTKVSSRGLKIDLDKFRNRDILSSDNSQRISTKLNFGLYSIRQVYSATTDTDFRKQIQWRQFYQCILKYHPRAKEYIHLDPRFDSVKWQTVDNIKKEWKDFMKCETNVLLVDAAMSELLQTGFMNNRMRIVWGTYVTKYLRIQIYDKHGIVALFSKYLEDCSTSQNKLNCEWVLGSLDLSGKQFSPKGKPLAGRPMNVMAIKKYKAFDYIRKWVPRCGQMTDKEILSVVPKHDPAKQWQEWIRSV
jgi:deoxyribodipyrimidine photo-lyase